jgi:hypothetical protein
VLIKQEYSEEDDMACIADICRYLTDERYIRVNGKPLISIFSPDSLPDTSKTIKTWRDYCRKNGFGEIHLVGIDGGLQDNSICDFDGVIAHPPNIIDNLFAKELHNITRSIDNRMGCAVYDMGKYVHERMYLNSGSEKYYKGIIPSFDNSARRSDSAHIMNVSPNHYKEWLSDILKDSKKNFESGNRFVFINAWNEWAEGMHLEPDRKYGYAYLQATADAVIESKSE